jgi:ketosteroid isomerase-like protein
VTPLQVMQQFVACINRQDVDGLAALMTDDHRFIDSLGQVVTGRENMRQGWKYYFAMVPDYELVPESWMSEGDTAVMLGSAHGSYSPDGVKSPERKWSCPAACRAAVQGGLLAEWRVYADNEPLRQLMKAHAA